MSLMLTLRILVYTTQPSSRPTPVGMDDGNANLQAPCGRPAEAGLFLKALPR
jgi:hypothetical protein